MAYLFPVTTLTNMANSQHKHRNNVVDTGDRNQCFGRQLSPGEVTEIFRVQGLSL